MDAIRRLLLVSGFINWKHKRRQDDHTNRDGSDTMSKCFVSAMIGVAIGMYIGYHEEEEIEDFCRQSMKKKKKMMKKMHKTYDHVCDCMDLD